MKAVCIILGFIPLLCTVQATYAHAPLKDSAVLITIEQYLQLHQEKGFSFIYDARTKEEYEKTHIQNAVQAGTESLLKVAITDKNAVILLYSIANGRSVKLANKLRIEGYINVYALDGGIAAWIAKGLPFYSQSAIANLQDYKNSLHTDSLVLVDVGSAYCAPCVSLSRVIDSFSVHHPELKIIKLDMDKDAKLIAELKIAKALPTLVAYKKGSVVWKNKEDENWALFPQQLLKLLKTD